MSSGMDMDGPLMITMCVGSYGDQASQVLGYVCGSSNSCTVFVCPPPPPRSSARMANFMICY